MLTEEILKEIELELKRRNEAVYDLYDILEDAIRKLQESYQDVSEIDFCLALNDYADKWKDRVTK